VACFGKREFRLVGGLDCSHIVAEGGVSGARWMNDRGWCALDDELAIHGPAIDALEATRATNF
jgi:hypothetical protein